MRLLRLWGWLATVAALALTACNRPPEEPGRDPLSSREMPPRFASDEAALPGRIRQALKSDSKIDVDAISIAVSKGQVTLSGNVPADQIIRADTIARGVPGVKEVINALQPTLPAS
jgi:hyperosmotically inducible periplasmic protein